MAPKIDLDEFFEGDLFLPWRGQKWRIPEPTAKESERLRIQVLTMEGDEEIHEMRKLMGQTWNDLMDAGIGWCHLLHMGRTALLHFTMPPEVSESHWQLAQLSTLVDIDKLVQAAAEYQELKKQRDKLEV